MPEEKKIQLDAEVVGNAAVSAESIPANAETIRTMPNDSASFSSVPTAAERKENHTLTVREVARMFESAGVARTERSIINWCQPNRQGITRLDSYYDPNVRKYYLTPQSVEAVIQEEIQRSNKSSELPDSEQFGSSVAHVKHSSTFAAGKTDDERKIEELERELKDLKISNQVKDLFIDVLKTERNQVFEKFLPDNQLIGQFESKIQRLDEPQSSQQS